MRHCGDINRHLQERDELEELTQKQEKIAKKLEKTQKELLFREGIQEKTVEDQLRDKTSHGLGREI